MTPHTKPSFPCYPASIYFSQTYFEKKFYFKIEPKQILLVVILHSLPMVLPHYLLNMFHNNNY